MVTKQMIFVEFLFRLISGVHTVTILLAFKQFGLYQTNQTGGKLR